MNFLELQNATLQDSFTESRRADVKNWLNARYTWMWDYADWTFADATANVTVTAGSREVTLEPADLGVVYDLFRADSEPLEAITYDEYALNYLGTGNTSSGLPEAYTVLGTSILVGPTSSETNAGYLLSYQKIATLLSADGDTPAIPAGYHMALVAGAKGLGFKMTNVPLSQVFDAEYQAAIQAMSRKYLENNKPRGRQTPAYR